MFAAPSIAKDQSRRRACIARLALGASSCVVLSLGLMWQILPRPIRFDPARYGKACNAILSGNLLPDTEGIVALPSEFRDLSLTQSAYVLPVRHPKLIFFPSSDGKDLFHPFAEDNWIGGYVFDVDLKTRSKLPKLPDSWSVSGPYLEKGRARVTAPRSHQWNIVEQQAYGDGWFYAETFS